MLPHPKTSRLVAALALLALPALAAVPARAAWRNYAGTPQHSALSPVASLPMEYIIWQMPVDLNPQYTGSTLYIHYGSPVVTDANTLLVPVKTGVADSFRVEARAGATGAVLWQYNSDYTLPTSGYSWVPSFSGALTPSFRFYMPGAGGTLLYTDSPDAAAPHAFTRVAFYGLANYNANPGSYNTNVQICTPLTCDSQGNVYFGFRVGGFTPIGLASGIARVAPDGSGIRVSASTATSGAASQVLMNCAPALSNDEQTLYVAMRGSTSTPGYLVSLSASTLNPIQSVRLVDPGSSSDARLSNDGTSSPMVGPDGRVYFGVLENPAYSNADRGWMLSFASNLASPGAPGAFGWDDTPSLVPAGAVPSYAGASPYLLMTKYNNYANVGGDGVNKIAVLDPNATQVDPQTGVTVMKEILTIAGVTPDDQGPAYPNAVREWCINSAVVDTATHSVLAGSEDGVLYRWNLATNTFSESLTLTPGVGEAYTPTLIAPDGKVYAINNATLFAAGPASAGASREDRAGAGLRIAPARPDPFTAGTAIPFSLPRSGRAKIEILDLNGRRVSVILDRDLPAGQHEARWDGRDSDRRPSPAGIYFVRLASAGRAASRRIVLAR